MDGIDLARDADMWGEGFCEYGNERSGFIKCGEFLE